MRVSKYNHNPALKQIETLKNKEQELSRHHAAPTFRAEEREREVERLKALLNRDGSNSGLPTGMTPLNKNKVIPNSRKKTGKKIGGQGGHTKHKPEKFRDEEVNVQARTPYGTLPPLPVREP